MLLAYRAKTYTTYKITVPLLNNVWVTWSRTWLMHCATSRKVLLPLGLIGFFTDLILGSPLTLTEISSRYISWGVKVAGAWGCKPWYNSYDDCLEIPWVSTFWILKACPGLEGDSFTFSSENNIPTFVFQWNWIRIRHIKERNFWNRYSCEIRGVLLVFVVTDKINSVHEIRKE